MIKICVVTGGGSGMGLAAAKLAGKDSKVILAGRTASKLDGALKELQESGIDTELFSCDVSNRDSVKDLVKFAAEKGTVVTVIHAAGMSPQMGKADVIFDVNALGTIYVNEEFSKIMGAGSCILNVSSMSAYMAPQQIIPSEAYQSGLENPEQFKEKIHGVISAFPEESASGVAYMLSKNFVVWYTVQTACALGKKGIRVVSVSPGTFKTPMGELEGEAAASIAFKGALGRVGEVNEVAELIAFLVSDKASYITGTDILCDGGTVASMKKAQ